jgi:uncharacterized protein (TIGR02271 family)
MSLQDDLTTLVCLFHHSDRAHSAIQDLTQAGIPPSTITLIGGNDAPVDALDKSELASLGMPNKDYDHLKDGIRDGGLVLAVSAAAKDARKIEDIFEKHSAGKIDEAEKSEPEAFAGTVPVASALPATSLNAETAIPVVEEEMVVGKRAVDQGGVRVYRHVVEIPVEESVTLREEHVTMERRPVDRGLTDADVAFGARTIELTETAEEAVISKNARVVEEVLIGKTASEHTETIHDTVRKTEVEVEEIPGSARTPEATRRS